MTAPPYLTAPGDVYAPGWVQVDDGLWLTREPLRDRATGLYARLTYDGALDACEALGGALATADDVERLHWDAFHGTAIEIPPVTLPTVAMVRAAGYAGPVNAQAFQDAAQRLRVACMMGLEWAKAHDAAVLAHLADAGWDGAMRVAGIGKHWVAGAPPGRAYLFGWWDGHRYIQPRPQPGSHGPHDRGHHDYATTTLCRRTTPPPIEDDDTADEVTPC